MKKADSFIVIDKGLRLLMTPVEGWYAVQGLDVRGLNTQGKTIEEALLMAHDAAEALTEARTMLAKATMKKTREAIRATTLPKRKPRRSQSVEAK